MRMEPQVIDPNQIEFITDEFGDITDDRKQHLDMLKLNYIQGPKCQGNDSFQSKLQDVVCGNIKLTPSLESSAIRGCSVNNIELDDKFLLFFSIVNQSSNAVVITDVNKYIVYVNKKFEKISGYSSNEVLGQNSNILKSSKTPLSTYLDLHKALDAKQQWSGEFINNHRNGSEYIEEVVISPIVNTKGDVVCYMAEKKDITEHKKAEKAIQQLIHFDSLTNVPNRNYFLEEVEKLISMPHSDENQFALLFVDLNRFKEINDTYGHQSGDKTLQTAATRIENVISPDDFLARVGGDEFVIVHKYATDTSIHKLALSVADSFRAPIFINGETNYLGVSIGSACWPQDGLSIRKVLSRADQAMYIAKSSDENYCCYNKNLGNKFERDINIARRLSVALKENSLSLVFQPKIDLKTREICGLEALLRWTDEQLGEISPVEFIPIAEKHKLMVDIGNWVISEVCKQIKRWQAQYYSFNHRVALNISVQQIESVDFYNQIMTRLYKENISPSQLELEVTESVLISEPERVMALSSQLRKVGFNISIDDFGTGYSSMCYLKRLKANILKIDQSFVRNIISSDHDHTIIKSIIDLGHNLGLTIIAEGVETYDQLNMLQRLGCDLAQGYLFCKPLAAEKLHSFFCAEETETLSRLELKS